MEDLIIIYNTKIPKIVLMRDDKPSLLANVFQNLALDIMCIVETQNVSRFK